MSHGMDQSLDISDFQIEWKLNEIVSLTATIEQFEAIYSYAKRSILLEPLPPLKQLLDGGAGCAYRFMRKHNYSASGWETSTVLETQSDLIIFTILVIRCPRES